MLCDLLICSSLLLCAGSASASESRQGRADWLTGTWTLCEDPDNSPKDSLQFNADGTGLLVRAKGNVQFLHKQSGQSVSLLANANGYAISIELSASADLSKLLLHSDETGNTAIYIRADNPEAGSCSIK
jgi:hypothetical protein